MSAASIETTTQIVRPARSVRGSLMLPGDKSISHRYAMLAGYASGTTAIENFSTGADPHSSLACMQAMGATVESDGKVIRVTGAAGNLHAPATDLDCGNSGSTMRMLAGLVAGQRGDFRFIGDESLTVRPMERIRKPLELMGAKISLTGGHAPMTVHGSPLKAIDFESPIASAQVKTAVLFAGLQAEGTTSIAESVRTRDHSEHALRAFGVQLDRAENRLRIRGGQQLTAPGTMTVPGDMSSAAFFLCAALLFQDSNLVLDELGVNPTRAAMLDVVSAMGGVVKVLDVQEKHGEMVGTLQVNRGRDGLKGIHIAGDLAAQLIDELPVIAAIAPFTTTGVRIRDARELRVKESDRIALVVKNLRAMGAEVTEHEDGMDIPGNQTLRGGIVDSGLDHRIAMAFSVAALRAEGETEIHGAEAASISFPEFFTWLDELAVR
jgi:3-phosphoshikimate 1-carboxyvinyltransferase